MKRIKGVKQKKMWAVFSPDGYIQFRTITDTREEARYLTISYHERGVKTWNDYAAVGYTTNKILVDIKLI